MRRKNRLPIYIGRTFWEDDPRLGCRDIGINSDSHLITVAATGGGKSYYAVHNTLCDPSGENYSLFCLDPKGEHAERSGKIREQFGPVHYIDTSNIVPHLYADREPTRYNPFDDIDLSDPVEARAGFDQIVKACLLPETQETSNSKHFRINAEKVMLGILAHVISELPAKYHNLPSVYRAFLTGHPENGVADKSRFKQLVAAMKINEAFGGAPMDAAKVLEEAGENEGGGFITSCATALSWCAREDIAPFLMSSTFSMRDLKTKKASVYLVIPFDLMANEGVRLFLRLVIGFGFYGCRKEAARCRTLFCLDEIMQLGTFLPLQNGLTTLRGRLTLWLQVQNLGQLKRQYPNYDDFMSSCSKQFFAVTDTEGTAEAIVKELGRYMSKSPEGARHDSLRELRSAAEVREDLRKGSGMQYFIPTDGAPMRLKLVPFTKRHRRYGKVSNTEHG